MGGRRGAGRAWGASGQGWGEDRGRARAGQEAESAD